MSKKLYFREDNDENGYPLAGILRQMKDEGINELKIFEAEMERGSGYFYCTFHNECGETKQSCGKQCDEYKPRNKKNGRCRFSNNVYEQTDKMKILKLKNSKQ